MGVFNVTLEAGDPLGSRFVSVEALVDTGASYTILPSSLLRELGVTPEDQQQFILADGKVITRDIGETRVRVDGRERSTVVVFGDSDALALLGALTLEALGLGVDPMGRKLIRVPGYLTSSP